MFVQARFVLLCIVRFALFYRNRKIFYFVLWDLPTSVGTVSVPNRKVPLKCGRESFVGLCVVGIGDVKYKGFFYVTFFAICID